MDLISVPFQNTLQFHPLKFFVQDERYWFYEFKCYEIIKSKNKLIYGSNNSVIMFNKIIKYCHAFNYIYSIDHKPCGQLQPCHKATKNKNNVEHIQ